MADDGEQHELAIPISSNELQSHCRQRKPRGVWLRRSKKKPLPTMPFCAISMWQESTGPVCVITTAKNVPEQSFCDICPETLLMFHPLKDGEWERSRA